ARRPRWSARHDRMGHLGASACLRLASEARRRARAAPRLQPRDRLLRRRLRSRRRPRDRKDRARVIGVLVSGEGTNLQALLDARLPVVAVASNKRGARALERAARVGVPAKVFELSDFASRRQRDTALADWLEQQGVEL